MVGEEFTMSVLGGSSWNLCVLLLLIARNFVDSHSCYLQLFHIPR